jgi:nitrogen fixation/metabolism regulation signal transduction histidine kinase
MRGMGLARQKRQPGLRGTTIRGRIALSMLCAAALIVPAVIISLFYIRRMNTAVGQIVNQDIELMHVADRISLEFLEARRGEKNFLLYGDTTYLIESMSSLRNVSRLCAEGRLLDPALAMRFDSVCELTAAYGGLTDSLLRLPRTDAARIIITPGLSELRAHYESLLRAASKTESEAARDSLRSAAALVAGEISVPIPGYRSINDSILSLQTAMAGQTDSIISHAQRRVIQHRDHARQLATWGQRNILTVLLLVLVVLVWLIIILPRRVVLPIKRISNALHRVEEGNLDIRIQVRTGDELGQLARQLNRALSYLHEFDARKVSRILQLEKRFKLLLNDIAEGVLVVDRTPNIIVANPAVEELLGARASEVQGKRLRDFPEIGFVIPALEKVLSGSTSHQTCDILPEMPGSVVCIEALRDPAGKVTGALIVISHPKRPQTTSAEGSQP